MDAEVVFIEAESVSLPVTASRDQPNYGVDGVDLEPIGGVNLFDGTRYDSQVARKFATLLENTLSSSLSYQDVSRFKHLLETIRQTGQLSMARAGLRAYIWCEKLKTPSTLMTWSGTKRCEFVSLIIILASHSMEQTITYIRLIRLGSDLANTMSNPWPLSRSLFAALNLLWVCRSAQGLVAQNLSYAVS